MNIMQRLTDWADRLEAMLPHGKIVLGRADYYACRIIDHLQEIEDILRGEGETEGKLVKTMNLVNGTPSTIDIRNDADWELQTVILGHPSAAAVVTLTQAGIPRYAKETAAAGTDMPAGVILARGQEVTALSTGGDVQVTIYAKAKKSRKARAIKPRTEPREAAIGAQETIDPDRHFTDEATHVSTTDPYDLGVPLDAEHVRKIPFPPYEG